MLLMPDFMDEALRLRIKDWVVDNRESRFSNWSTPQTWWFRPGHMDADFPNFIIDYKKKLINHFGLEEWADPNERLYSQVSMTTEGGFVHEHDHNYDKNPPEYYRENADMRLNTMIQAPPSGPELTLLGIRFNAPQNGDLWTFNAFQKHGVDPVRGKVPRIVLSFGFHVPISVFYQYQKDITSRVYTDEVR